MIVPARFASFEAVTCEAPDAIATGASADLGHVDVSVGLGAATEGGGGSGSGSGSGGDGGGGVGRSAPLRVRYSGIVISAIAPLAGPTTGGSMVTLHGAGLGGVERCRFGGERTPDEVHLHYTVAPVAVSEETVVCASPGHPTGEVTLRLSSGGVHWSNGVPYHFYELPIVHGLRPASGRSDGGTLLRVLGFGLDSWPPANASEAPSLAHARDNRTATAFCRFGAGEGALLTPLLSRTSTVFKCVVPPHPIGHIHVEITLNGQDFTGGLPVAVFTYYPEPDILTVEPRGGPIEGGSTVMILGSGFTPRLLTERHLLRVVCRFGDRFHADFQHTVAAHFVTDTQVHCYAPSTVLEAHPDGYTGIVPMSVALNGGADATPSDVDFVGRSPIPAGFLYYRITLLAVQPSGGPVHGGTYVTLDGAGFSAMGSACGGANATAANATAGGAALDAGSGDRGAAMKEAATAAVGAATAAAATAAAAAAPPPPPTAASTAPPWSCATRRRRRRSPRPTARSHAASSPSRLTPARPRRSSARAAPAARSCARRPPRRSRATRRCSSPSTASTTPSSRRRTPSPASTASITTCRRASPPSSRPAAPSRGARSSRSSARASRTLAWTRTARGASCRASSRRRRSRPSRWAPPTAAGMSSTSGRARSST